MAQTMKDNDYFGSASFKVPKNWFNSYPSLKARNDTQDGFENLVPAGQFLVHIVGQSKFDSGYFDYYLSLVKRLDNTLHNKTAAIKLGEDVKSFWSKHSG